MNCSYNPNKNNMKIHLEAVSSTLDFLQNTKTV